MRRRRFERLVAEALSELPSEFRERLENVEITVEDEPTAEDLAEAGLGPEDTLLGLYQGIPITARDSSYNLVVPDRIIIYQYPIEDMCDTAEEIKDEVRRTVIHEIAHYFGIGDEKLENY